MFSYDQICRVNANQVGEHPPETLLVVTPDRVRKRVRSWNMFPDQAGDYWRVVDAIGNPMFLSFEMTEADLQFIRIEDHLEDDQDGEDTPLLVDLSPAEIEFRDKVTQPFPGVP